jgi:AraC-like DNA-binding protein
MRRPLPPRRPAVSRAPCRGASQVRRRAFANTATTSPRIDAAAHELSRSIVAMVCNARAALRWLDAGPPNLSEARLALGRIAGQDGRAGGIAGPTGRLLGNGAAEERSFDPDEAGAVALVGGAMSAYAISTARCASNDFRVDIECGSETGKRRTIAPAEDARREQMPAGRRFEHQERQRARLHSFIELRLDDPELSVECIAKGCNMSLRSVHRAFATDPTGSASRYFWMRRVERCADDLRDPGQADRPITDICFSWGFNSTSHFSRLFKERYGVTPRDYRVASRRSSQVRNSTPGLDLSSNSTNESATLTW